MSLKQWCVPVTVFCREQPEAAVIADTPDELHAMADRIGVARRWFQAPPKASFWHYDIAKSKRELAVAAGALDCDRNTFVEALRRIRGSRVFEGASR